MGLIKINMKLSLEICAIFASHSDEHTPRLTPPHFYPCLRLHISFTLARYSEVRGKCASCTLSEASALCSLNNVDVESLDAPCMSVTLQGFWSPFVAAAAPLTINPSILHIQLQGCRKLANQTLLTTTFWRFHNAPTKGVQNAQHILCLWGQCPSQGVRESMVRGIESDWQTNPAPMIPSMLLCPLVLLPPPTLCLHPWLCKPPHNVGALKWQWKLWLIFVKTLITATILNGSLMIRVSLPCFFFFFSPSLRRQSDMSDWRVLFSLFCGIFFLFPLPVNNGGKHMKGW